MAASGRVELILGMVGKDQLTAVLKKGQDGLYKLAGATRKVVNQAGKISNLKVAVEGVSGRWQDMSNKVNVARAAIESIKAAYMAVSEFIIEGEQNRNMGLVFSGLAKNADEVLRKAREATGEAVDDDQLRRMIIKVQAVGGTMQQAIDLIGAATRATDAQVGEFEQIFERFMGSVLSGGVEEVKIVGGFVKLKEAVERVAQARGISVEEMEEEEKISIRMNEMIIAMEKKYRELGVRWSLMTRHSTGFQAKLENLKSTLQGLVVGQDIASNSSKVFVEELDEGGAVTQAAKGAIENLNEALLAAQKEYEGVRDMAMAAHDDAPDWTDFIERNLDVEGVLKKFKLALEGLGVSAQDQEALFAQVTPKIVTNWETAMKEIERTGRNIDKYLEYRRQIQQHETVQWLHSLLKETVSIEDKITSVASDLWDKLTGQEKKKKKPAAKRVVDPRIKEEKKIAEDWAMDRRKLAGEEIAELFQHELNTKKLKNKRWRDEAIMNKALEMEGGRHREKMKEIQNRIGLDAFDFVVKKDQAKAEEIEQERARMEQHDELMARVDEARQARLEAEKMQREEMFQVQATYASNLQSLSQQTSDDSIAVLGTLSAATSQLATDMDRLKKGSGPALQALGSVATGAIRNTRAKAAVEGVFAQATAFLALAQGNIPGYIAGQLSAAAYFAIAGKSGASGGKGQGKLSGIASGGASTQGSFGGQGGNVTVNVQGFVGSTVDLSSNIQGGLATMHEAHFATGATA